MLTLLLTLLICVFAASQIVETLHHGSFFQGWRMRAADHVNDARWFVRKLAHLLQCPFCLSHWTSAMTVTLACYVAVYLPGTWGAMATFIVLVFAVTRGSQLLNDLTHLWCRSPTDDEEDETPILDQESSNGQIASELPVADCSNRACVARGDLPDKGAALLSRGDG